MKPKQRTRRKIPWDGSATRAVWSIQHGTHVYDATIPYCGDEIVDQLMTDYTTVGTRRYQDCLNDKMEGKYYYPIPGSLESHLAIASGTVPTGQFITQYPISTLIRDSDIHDKARLQHNLRTPDAIKAFERPFSDSSIPKDVSIDVDPFDTGFSIWFLIADVYQMKGLWRSLLGSAAMQRRIRRLAQGGRYTAKQLADDHLGVQFGLLPTIRDITQFVHLCSRWASRVDDMKERLGKTRPWHAPETNLVPTHYAKGITEFSGTSYCVMPLFQTVPALLRAKVETSHALLRRTASYSFTCPEFQGWLARLRQFIDAFGIIDPAALWDVIPFSFIADWFFGIGNWLHKNRPRLFPADVVIHDYCESIIVKSSVLWYASYLKYVPPAFPASWTTVQVPEHFIGSEVYTTYVRRRFEPQIGRLSLPSTNSAVTLRRILIAASLIAQRVPR